MVIRRDLHTPTVKEEIRRYISQYSARLSAHPNDLVVKLMAQSDNRRLRRHLSNDLPQSQSHITTDDQSVSMSWCQAQCGTFDQRFFSGSKLRSCLCGAPSLTRGLVCRLPVLVNTVHSSQSVITYIIYILCHTHFSDLQYIQASFSPGFLQQIMLYLHLLVAYSTTAVLDT
jgi:hypothetical protein